MRALGTRLQVFSLLPGKWISTYDSCILYVLDLLWAYCQHLFIVLAIHCFALRNYLFGLSLLWFVVKWCMQPVYIIYSYIVADNIWEILWLSVVSIFLIEFMTVTTKSAKPDVFIFIYLFYYPSPADSTPTRSQCLLRRLLWGRWNRGSNFPLHNLSVNTRAVNPHSGGHCR